MEYPVRINKYLRDQGLVSRREADEYIRANKVTINGKPATPGQMITKNDKVVIKGAREKKYTYLAYYKPRGLATQAPAGEESVIEKWRRKGLFPVGRLDKESEGLLILTDDRRLTRELIGTGANTEKEYLVCVREPLRNTIPAIFKKGMNTTTFGKLLPAQAKLLDKQKLIVILKEGRRHQVRVMLSELGYTITMLKRVRVGIITLEGLKPGDTKKIEYPL